MMDDSASAKKLTQQQIDSTMQRLWLNYYNGTLFDRGIISEAE